jgi:AcrR family transcriptional regulator
MNDTAAVTPITAGKQTPRRLRRAAEILAAAREVFLDKGFERSSVAEIAARVGVVEGLVYTYFPTKRELLNEVLRGMYVPLLNDIEASFRAHPRPAQPAALPDLAPAAGLRRGARAVAHRAARGAHRPRLLHLGAARPAGEVHVLPRPHGARGGGCRRAAA